MADSNIEELLNQILSAVFGKDVRQAIHDGIEQCYEDGKVGAVDLVARQRIDNLAKLPEGSTTGDAELADIRVGEDGTEYETAGKAVREQVSGLKNILSPVVSEKLIWTDGYYLYCTESNEERLVENANYSVTDYIEIPKYVSFSIRTYMSGLAHLLMYDENKTVTNTYTQTSEEMYGEFLLDIESSEKKRYVRFSCYTPNKERSYVYNKGSMTKLTELMTELTNNVLKGFGSRISSGDMLQSLDDAEPNRVYVFTGRIDDSQPSDTGTMLALNTSSENNGGHVQIFVTSDNKVLSRIKWSKNGNIVFNDWDGLINETELAAIIVDKLSYTYADISVFGKVGVIGDSFASGVIYPSDYVSGGDANYTHYEKSWIQVLGRKYGFEAVNYSVGGCTTRSWLTNQIYGKNKMESDTPCDLYFMCLGINDSNISMGDYLGTESDIETGADTFYGNYGKIVSAVKEHAPDAIIVFTTYCRKPTENTIENYDAFNQAIINIAEHYGVPCLVLTNDAFFNSDFYMNHMNNNHPTAVQYVGYANAIGRLLSKCMIENYQYFRDYSAKTESDEIMR